MTQKSLKNLMMVVLSVSLAIGAVLAGGCASKEIETPPPETPPPINEPEPPPPEIPNQTIEDITPQEAFALIQDNQDNRDFAIIDVQAPAHFAGGHIEGAINLYYHSETFRDELDKLDKTKTYLIYYTCHCGDIDTKSLYLMKELNFTEVYNISGGLIRWVSEGFPTVRETPPPIIEDITAVDAFVLTQENQDSPDLVIIDMRTPAEFADGHIENAINLDYHSETFQDELDKLDKTKTYLIYCAVGIWSGRALDMMAGLDFGEVYKIAGGLNAWKAEGFPTVQETPGQISKSITPQQAFALIQDNQDNPDFVIIDIRSPGEFANGHIEDAINIYYQSENFRDELDQLDKDKIYLIYYKCACGGIDRNTLGIMVELNFSEVYNISGGLDRWKIEELPTTVK